MSKKRRDLTPDEKKLWRRVAASVKTRRLLPDAPEEAAEDQLKARVAPASPASPRVASARVRVAAPQDRGNEKRVRRGKLEIGGKFDLHGHTQETGRAALERFLRAAHGRGDRTVIVVTGTGRGGEGVLKRRLPEWLAERGVRALVSGFAPAHRVHGGAGAFYVFLKRTD